MQPGLFDLESDPGEERDLSRAQPELKRRVLERYGRPGPGGRRWLVNPRMSVVRLLVAVVALAATQGCSMFESRTLVYVDNGGTAEVEVRVDEAAPVTVAAGATRPSS